MATHRFEWDARRVLLQFVVARDDADLSADLDAHLRRAGHVASRMQRHARSPNRLSLSIFDEGDACLRPEPHLQNSRTCARGQITIGADPRVIAVSMRYDCPSYRSPRIDIEIACCAVQTVECFFEYRHALGRKRNALTKFVAL